MDVSESDEGVREKDSVSVSVGDVRPDVPSECGFADCGLAKDGAARVCGFADCGLEDPAEGMIECAEVGRKEGPSASAAAGVKVTTAKFPATGTAPSDAMPSSR